jgi:hypothetical protein
MSCSKRIKTKSGQGFDEFPLRENRKAVPKWKFFDDLSFLLDYMIESSSKDSLVNIKNSISKIKTNFII